MRRLGRRCGMKCLAPYGLGPATARRPEPPPAERNPSADYRRAPVIYDHPKMIQLALEELRARFGVEPDPDHLLRETFTLRQLALLHGAVAGEPIAPQELDTFRRYMQGRLDPTGKTVEGGGRPAELFRRKPGATAGRLTAELRTADPMPAWRRRRSGSSSDRRTSGR